MCCVYLVALLGFGIWKKGLFDTIPSATSNDSINIDEKDSINPDELNANADIQTSKNDTDLSNNSSATEDSVENHPNNYSSNESKKTMISSFIINGAPSASYEAPENGKFYFSMPLSEAMNKYGDSVLYRVVVDVFNNNEQLSSDSIQVQDECERLSNIGYVVAYETVSDGESYHDYFTLHATYDELTEFIANENYGYFMFLYDERVDSTVESPISSNNFRQ